MYVSDKISFVPFIPEINGNSSPVKKPHTQSCYYICQDCLVHLGDIGKYAAQDCFIFLNSIADNCNRQLK